MTTRMLIDARHPEETRVVVLNGNRIDEFDFEAAARKQIKGNIYLAKVTRVEPSLQAAFVDYGGNRHGFLAFSEIHPDYYQIPKEDREALLREERALADEGSERDDARDDALDDAGEDAQSSGEDGNGPGRNGMEEHDGGDEVSAEVLRRRRMALRRRYKIQEVVRRRQVMLVQVVKEERGNKGAALTTYLSLAGRYCVLMPNTAHGGGISRKIASVADRRRLKQIIAELALPPTMGAIVRTAGLERTKTEIKRDFDYLTRLWDEIRTKTLASQAPTLIHEDSDLIKRAIRDIYNREIDEVLVDGEAGYKQAKDFMKLLMPSHARKVQLYSDPVPLFQRAAVEGQLAALMNPVVTLKSGGYIVINSTEALVAVDVNSGRSTREYNIEETATKTNIEAAEEVARQLRLRDLAGLVVVDFIDMESSANNKKVERALKDALKRDRARIQVGRISGFGLLEMSRQRLRTGVLEASTEVCPTCNGTGLVRTPGSAALAALRLIEEEAVRGRNSLLRLRADRPVALYMLNRKRRPLAELEERYGIQVEIVPDDALTGARIELEPSGPPPERAPVASSLPPLVDGPATEDEEEAATDATDGNDREAADGSEGRDSAKKRRRRRRPRKDRRDRDEQGAQAGDAGPAPEADGADADQPEADAVDTADASDTAAEAAPARKRGRRKAAAEPVADAVAEGAAPAAADTVGDAEPAEARPARKRRRTASDRAADEAAAAAGAADADVADAGAADSDVADALPAKPKRASRKKASPPAEPSGAQPVAAAGQPAVATPDAPEPAPANAMAEPVAADAAPQDTDAAPRDTDAAPQDANTNTSPSEPETANPPRRGWWQRTFGS